MKNGKTYYAFLFLFLTVQAFIINPLYAAMQDDVDRSLLQKAENYYYDGDFDNAIKSANQFLSQSHLSKDDKKEASILLVHIFLAKSDAASAKKVVESILGSDPAYTPTLEEETPKYVTFVTEVKKQYEAKQVKTEKKGIDWLVWGGAGAGATLLIILLASGGAEGSSEKKLNSPPQFPDN